MKKTLKTNILNDTSTNNLGVKTYCFFSNLKIKILSQSPPLEVVHIFLKELHHFLRPVKGFIEHLL